MLQQVIVYILVSAAFVYAGYRLYSSVKKQEACGKCELMKAAKAEPKK
jgi:hypothetical protein